MAIHIASHELNHAIAAQFLGIPVNKISVNDSEGKTTFSQDINPEAYKYILLAGLQEDHDGVASGFSWDIAMAEFLTLQYGGSPLQEIQGNLGAALSGYSNEVRERAAEIVAFLGEISGSDLPAIFEQAELELKQESQGDSLFDEDLAA